MSLQFYKGLIDTVDSKSAEINMQSSAASPRAYGWPVVNSSITFYNTNGPFPAVIPPAVDTVTEAAINAETCHWIGTIATASIGTGWVNFTAYNFISLAKDHRPGFGQAYATEYWYVRKSGNSYQFTTQMILTGRMTYTNLKQAVNAYKIAIRYSLGAKLINV